jgi:hypothetical protein
MFVVGIADETDDGFEKNLSQIRPFPCSASHDGIGSSSKKARAKAKKSCECKPAREAEKSTRSEAFGYFAGD